MKHLLRTIIALTMACAMTLSVSTAQGAVSAQALVEKLAAAGLEVASPTVMTRADYGAAPFLCRGMRFGLPTYGDTAFGRAFYCARKSDRDKLARYYTSLGQRNPELYVHVFVNAPYILTLDGAVADEAAAPYDAVLKGTQTQSKATAVTPVNTAPGFRVEIHKVGYEQWGRPEIMDNPNFRGLCRGDNKRPVLKLGISVVIHNTGSATWPTGARSMKFFKADGMPAIWCWYDYLDDKDYPPIAPGNAWVLSYAVFVEKNERVSYGIFKVDNVGEVRFDIPQNLQMP
jgi:hypothetical protein